MMFSYKLRNDLIRDCIVFHMLATLTIAILLAQKKISNECCFRSRFCTVMLHWPGYNLG